jgi:hypothetical protein
MNKVGFTGASAIFAVALFGSWGMMLLINPSEPLVLLYWLIVMIVWAIVIQWWIVAGLLVGMLLSAEPFGLCCGLLMETAIWARRKPRGFWRNVFFPQ